MHFAGASGIFDAIGAVDEIASSSLHAEAVECRLAKCSLGLHAKVCRHSDSVGLERALQGGLELVFGDCAIKLGAGYTDPCTATRRSCPNVGGDPPVRTERESDQLAACAFAACENARPLGNVRLINEACRA
jgi:hypothetical protein